VPAGWAARSVSVSVNYIIYLVGALVVALLILKLAGII
jgi:hypothetical protein